MGKDSKFVINMGPGNTVGAMAIGPGAKAEGTVTIGGHRKHAGKRLRMSIDIRGAVSREQISEWLRQIRKDLLDDGDSGAIGEVAGDNPSGCAWRIEDDK